MIEATRSPGRRISAKNPSAAHVGKKTKQPFHFRRKDSGPFAFAGLWEHWEGEQPAIDSCTIITTDAKEVFELIRLSSRPVEMSAPGARASRICRCALVISANSAEF